MALRNEDKVWIAQEIRTAIREHLDPHGWRKLREHLPLVGIFGVFVALLGLAGAGWKEALSNRASQAQFETHTNDRLDQIEGTLKLLNAQIVAAKYANAPQQELKTHRDELTKIKTTLATARKNVPEYWPVAFQIIELTSKANSELQIPEGRPSIFDNFVSRPIGGMSPTVGQQVILRNKVEGMIFKDCVIHFDASARLTNDVFINCVFIFPADTQEPSTPLQNIGQALLLANLSNVTITAS